MNTEKPNLLCIDDEKRILRSLKVIFRRTHNVYTTTCPNEYKELLKKHNIHVIISDQRMPEVTGTELLRRAAKWSPNSMRILLTGYADLAAVIDSINEGEIFRYLTKPWNNEEIKIVVQKATEIALKSNKKPQMLGSTKKHLPLSPNTSLQPSILLIDENTTASKNFCDNFCSKYNILCANDFNEVEQFLTTKQFHVAVINIEFRGENLSPLIFLLKKKQPALITIILADFDDIRSLIDLINKGQVFRCLPNPVSNKMLERSLQRAVKRHEELNSDTKQQLRHQTERIKNSVKSSINTMKISGMIRRIGKMIRL